MRSCILTLLETAAAFRLLLGRLSVAVSAATTSFLTVTTAAAATVVIPVIPAPSLWPVTIVTVIAVATVVTVVTVVVAVVSVVAVVVAVVVVAAVIALPASTTRSATPLVPTTHRWHRRTTPHALWGLPGVQDCRILLWHMCTSLILLVLVEHSEICRSVTRAATSLPVEKKGAHTGRG